MLATAIHVPLHCCKIVIEKKNNKKKTFTLSCFTTLDQHLFLMTFLQFLSELFARVAVLDVPPHVSQTTSLYRWSQFKGTDHL